MMACASRSAVVRGSIIPEVILTSVLKKSVANRTREDEKMKGGKTHRVAAQCSLACHKKLQEYASEDQK